MSRRNGGRLQLAQARPADSVRAPLAMQNAARKGRVLVEPDAMSARLPTQTDVASGIVGSEA